MAILQRVALYPSERLDIPDARAIEAFALNDMRFLMSGILADKSYVISGFEVSNYANIFSAPGFKLRLSDVSLIHTEATTQAAGFYVANGQEADAVVTLSSGPSPTINYVEVDLTIVSGTPDIRSFWDSGANSGEGGEYTDTVDTINNLQLVVSSNISGFTSGKIPLYRVTTQNGIVTKLDYCINNFYRLAPGGNSPDPNGTFVWPSLPDSTHARQEGANSVTSYTATNAPFQGGDKNITSLKAWMDAAMTVMKEIKGTPYWYTAPSGSGSSLINAIQNSSLLTLMGGSIKQLGVSHQITNIGISTITIPSGLPGTDFFPGGGTFNKGAVSYAYTSYVSSTGIVTGVTPTGLVIGDVITQGEVGHLKIDDGTTIYRMGRQYNHTIAPFSDIDMTPTNSRVLYLLLPSSDVNASYGLGDDGLTPVKPKLVTAFNSSSITVGTGGNYKTSGGTILVRGIEFTYTAYSSGAGVFTGVSPDPSSIAVIGDSAYQAPTGGTGTLMLSAREDVPGQTGSVSEGAERVLWLAIYDGIGTIKTRDGEIQPGEVIDIGNNDTLNLITYIGSTGPADSFPVYDVKSIDNGTNLTDAITTAFQIIETPIYDETVAVPVGGFSSGYLLTLPVNSKTGFGETYTLGTDALVVYDDGVLLEPTIDYAETNTSSITFLRDIAPNGRIRLRIGNIGGATSAAQSSSLQAAYLQGNTINIVTGFPVEITGPAEKLLSVYGDVYVQGVIDPKAITFDPQIADPLASGQKGLWTRDNVGTTELMYKTDGNVNIPISQTIVNLSSNNQYFSKTMLNNSGLTIAANKVVYINAPGQIALADSTGAITSIPFGITMESIPNGSSGKVIYAGTAAGVLGSSMTSYVWLDTIAGEMSISPPQNPGEFQVILGIADGFDLIFRPQALGQVQ